MRTLTAPLPGMRTVIDAPGRVLRGLSATGEQIGHHVMSALKAIEMLPRLVVALERLAPVADNLGRLAEARELLDEIARETRQVSPAAGQLRALHEQIVEVACDLRALEPEIEGLAKTTATLDESIRVLAGTTGAAPAPASGRLPE